MTRKRKNALWRLLALLFAFSLVAAACGDDDDSTDAGSDDSTEEESSDDSMEEEGSDDAGH